MVLQFCERTISYEKLTKLVKLNDSGRPRSVGAKQHIMRVYAVKRIILVLANVSSKRSREIKKIGLSGSFNCCRALLCYNLYRSKNMRAFCHSVSSVIVAERGPTVTKSKSSK